MATWHKRARFVVAAGGVAFAVVVAMALRQRMPGAAPRMTASDPKAVAESTGGHHFKFGKGTETLDIEYTRLLTYDDNSTKMQGIRVGKDRDDGRHFTMSAKEADVAKDEADFAFTGDVRIAVSDGMLIHTEHATYKKADGVMRAEGPVDIARGRMTGSSTGLVYDDQKKLLMLADHVVLHMTPDARGQGAMDIAATNVTFDRINKVIHFDSRMRASRGTQVIEADTALAHLSADEERLEAIELRGNSRITGTEGGIGGLRSLTGRDVDLTYAPDGQTIAHALIVGGGLIQFAGEPGQEGRRIGANVVDLTLAPDGSTPTGLTARDSVQLVFPLENDIPARTINAQQLDGKGDATHGLTSAHFEGAVQFRERGPSVDRRAKSQALDVTLGPGLSSIDEANFTRAVQFEDPTMTATATTARYVLDKGTLDLRGDDPATVAPRLDTAQIGIDATTISVIIDGPIVKALGSDKSQVKSMMKRQPAGGDAKTSADTKLPAMLKKDQDVLIFANVLDYDGSLMKATYGGRVALAQGDTTIKGASMVIDSKTGDMSASGGDDGVVATYMIRQEIGADNKTTRTRSLATAKSFAYVDTVRQLTYDKDAHMVDSAGDLTAAKIELYLNASGDDLDRVEAYDTIALKETTRKTTGSHLTYTGAEGQYVVAGTPAHVVQTCGRDTSGKVVTFYRATDRITVSGGDNNTRTQTVGSSSSCP